MTQADRNLRQDEPVVGLVPSHPRLPLVSVVVVNYNYGRFLAEAVDSVFAQTYPRIECLVVDNASTDESAAVIAACETRHDGLRVLRRADNGGQTTACIEGLAITRGPYVVFLDADDTLLPDCIASHVAIHLSARVPVGLTSVDMLQVVGGETVLATNEAFSAFLTDPSNKYGRELLRPTDAALGALATRAEALTTRVALVPRTQKDWVWAPTSGNCFRRDALDLLCDGPNLGRLTSQTDFYLALGVNAISGSILIDEPLFAYRLHGANAFSNRPQLQGFLTFDSKRNGDQGLFARRLLVDQLVGRIERFVQQPWMCWEFFKMILRLDTVVEDRGFWHGGSYAARAVARRFDEVSRVAGRKPTLFFVAAEAPLPIRIRMALTGRPGSA